MTKKTTTEIEHEILHLRAENSQLSQLSDASSVLEQLSHSMVNVFGKPNVKHANNGYVQKSSREKIEANESRILELFDELPDAGMTKEALQEKYQYGINYYTHKRDLCKGEANRHLYEQYTNKIEEKQFLIDSLN